MRIPTDKSSTRSKIDRLNKRAFEKRVHDFPGCLKASAEALKLSKRIGYKEGMGHAMRSLGFCYVRLAKYNEGKPLIEEALTIHKSMNDLPAQSLAYQYLSIIQRSWGNFAKALEWGFRSIELSETAKTPEFVAENWYQVGITYKLLGHFDKALEYLFRASAYYEETDNPVFRSYPIQGIGAIYFENGDHQKALEFFKQALKYRQLSDDKLGSAGSLDSLGFTYFKLKQYKKAIEHCNKSLLLSKSTKDSRAQGNALIHLAEVYKATGDFDKAAVLSAKSMQLRRTGGDQRGETEILLFLAGLFSAVKNKEQEKTIPGLLQKALVIANRIKAIDLQSKTHFQLYNWYKSKEEFEKALFHLDAHSGLEKAFHQDMVNKKMLNLEIARKAEATRKEAERVMDKNEELTRLNKELEIETSLERVRTVAMGMKKPEDMLDVCRTISLQLQSLGVKEIRNVQTAIFYPERGSYMNYEYYAKHKKTFITDTLYTDHSVARAFAAKMLKGKGEVYITHIRGEKKVREWLAYQKKTNVFIDTCLETAGSLNYYWHSLGPVALGISTYIPLGKEDSMLFQRFLKVFELAYRRYMDIEKAEAQAREAKTEAALEKVRAQAMAMQKPADILNVCKVMFRELQGIGFRDVRNALINFWDDANHSLLDYDYSDFAGGNVSKLNYSSHPVFEQFQLKIRSSKDAFAQLIVTKDQLASWRKRRRESNEYEDPRLNKIDALYYYFYSIGVGAVGISTFSPLSPEHLGLLKRFRNVFHLAYRRYLDIEKAGAQAREAQIELGLERVRARAMAMHSSEELADLVTTLFRELKRLGFSLTSCIIWINEHEHASNTLWIAGGEMKKPAQPFRVHPFHKDFFTSVIHAWKAKDPKWTYALSGTRKKNFEKAFFRELPELPVALRKALTIPKRVVFSASFNNFGALEIVETEALNEEKFEILHRFGKVFDQTYTRFLDLKKAEAQAREAQIEAALERVRSRTMAMHKSEEVTAVAVSLCEELLKLGFEGGSTIIIIDRKTGDTEQWTGFSVDKSLKSCYVPYFKHPCHDALLEAWKKGDNFLVYTLKGEEKRSLDKHYFSTGYKIFPESDQKWMREMPSVTFSHVFMKYGAIHWGPDRLTDEQLQVLQRFSKVFEQSYTRFLDLQKAEEQAREAQIELGLERVRARAMAMQNSDELKELIGTVFTELTRLDLVLTRCLIMIYEGESNASRWWMANSEDPNNPMGFYIKEHDHPPIKAYREAWHARKLRWTYLLEGRVKKDWDDFLFSQTELKRLPQQVIQGMKAPDLVYLNASFNNFGNLTLASLEALSDEHFDILLRFAKVFDLTYTRFNDLKHAEAQAREAQIETALERVRSRTMGMQKSEELKEVIQVVYEQFGLLNIHVGHTGFVMDYKTRDDYTIWIADPHGAPSRVTIPYFDSEYYNRFNEAKEKGMDFFATHLDFEEKNKFYQTLFKYVPGITDEAKDFYFNCRGLAASTVLLENVALYIENFSGIPYTEEENNILGRFGKVFQQTYTRFIDLQRAETQAREAQIEAALERVRSASMAMHSSEELVHVIRVLTDQLTVLGFEFHTANFITNASMPDWEIWISSPGSNIPPKLFVPYFDHRLFNERNEAVVSGQEMLTVVLTPEEKSRFLHYFFEHSGAKNTDEVRIKWVLEQPGMALTTVVTKSFSLSVINYNGTLYTDAENEVIRRLAHVFEQSYTRFLDLQRAEAQARESQIQLALERVRARTMAMQRSDELPASANLLFHQIQTLGMPAWSAGYCTWEEDKKAITLWMSSEGVLQPPFKAPTTEDELFIQMRKGYEDGKSLHIVEMGGEELAAHYRYMRTLPVVGEILDRVLEAGHPLPTFQVMHYAYFSKGFLLFITYEPVPDAHDIFRRFAAVFDQTYTRFLDLQKAEAQAREAQIEAALERVRYSAMAMQNSTDVGEATSIMFTELDVLGIETFRCGIAIVEEDELEVWSIGNTGDGRTIKGVGRVAIRMHPLWERFKKAWQEKVNFLYHYLAGQEKEDYINALKTSPGYSLTQTTLQFPDLHFQTYHFDEGAIFTFSEHQHNEADQSVLKRFAKVFSLTFRRYLDLKQAEAQAKEAKIEVALERVRSKAMAMHSSQDLSETVGIFFKELKTLGITPLRCGVGELDEATRTSRMSATTAQLQGESYEMTGKLKLSGHPVLDDIFEHWKKQEEYFPILTGKDIKEYYQVIKPQVSFPDYPEGLTHYGNYFAFKEGIVFAWTENKMSEEELNIFRRFTSVISLTYRRYIELQKSEANAIEAIKQASLGRIRADIASMRTTDDLDRITPLIWNELTVLGIPFIRCGVFIMDEEQQLIHTFLSTPDGKAIGAFHLPFSTPGNIQQVLSNWKSKSKYIDHWQADSFIEFAQLLMKQGTITSPEQYMSGIPPGGFHLHFLPFLQGMLYVGNTEQLGEEEVTLIQSVADAFSTAYARYEDFNKLEAAKAQVDHTLSHLRQAQAQLVQSEKMASLGELTAGIAHEIQNPLNFVNNFSEVSNELLDEMVEEVKKGNYEEVQAIVNDVKQNLAKIHHHGRRADGIVKGMLQHSRSSSGQKELTDLNALADEYLRLAYHGLRAKDKTFNAKFETALDPSLPKVTIVPQDIGRVILNLITNAFYVVAEKKRRGVPGYEPTVTVSTQQNADRVEVSVKDNGSGIPPHVLDKIFQPFFTTKPTGQGTGLGLSLSYDIIKAHGGELKVETRENEGSNFIIHLPSV